MPMCSLTQSRLRMQFSGPRGACNGSTAGRYFMNSLIDIIFLMEEMVQCKGKTGTPLDPVKLEAMKGIFSYDTPAETNERRWLLILTYLLWRVFTALICPRNYYCAWHASTVTQVTQSPSRPLWLDYTSINGTLVPSIQRLAFPSLVVTCKFLGLSPRGVEATGLGMLRQSAQRTWSEHTLTLTGRRLTSLYSTIVVVFALYCRRFCPVLPVY